MFTKDNLQIAANIAIVVALIFLVIQIFIALLAYLKSIRQKKQDIALSLIERWNSKSFAILRRNLDLALAKLDRKDVNNYITSIQNNNLTGDIRYLLNFLEELALSVNAEIADFDVIYQFFRWILINKFESLEPYIKYLRSNLSDENLYIDFEKLYNLFLEQMKKKYRVPHGKYWKP